MRYMFKVIKVIIFCLFMTSCSHQGIVFNSRLIEDYRIKSNEKEKFQQPYISIFTHKKYQLHFVAAKHQNGAEGSTCRTIRDAFKKKFNFLIVEGVAFSTINNPQDINFVKQCKDNNFKNCGEDTCAVAEALSANTPFSYAEPDDLMIKEKIKLMGYTEEEMAFLYALRFIPEIRRMNINDIDGIKNRLQKYLKNLSTKRLNLASDMTLDNFEKIHKEKYNSPINYLEIDTNTTSPQIDQNPSWANILASKIGRIRNEFILKMIQDRLNQYHDVIVVYGAGHLVELRPALESMLGQSSDFKLF